MRKGFTLIEILIAISIVVILATTGAAISLTASRRKAVEITTDKLRSQMMLARSNALAGKVGSCSSGWLGWQVAVGPSQSILQLVCTSGTTDTSSFVYPAGVTVFPPTDILFNRLGSGTNLTSGVTFDIAGIFTSQLTVEKSGEIR